MTEAAYALVRVRNVGGGASLAAIARRSPARVTIEPPPHDRAADRVHRARPRALGVPAVGASRRSRTSSVAGMTEDEPRRGAWATSGPMRRRSGSGAGRGVPHLLVMFFAEPGRLDGLRADASTGDAWSDAFEVMRRLDDQRPRRRRAVRLCRRHQPAADRLGAGARRRRRRRSTTATRRARRVPARLSATSTAKYTDRPVVDAGCRRARRCLPAEDAPEKKDLGRNGTYLVMRQLRQDVRGFWQFVDTQAGGNLAEAEIGWRRHVVGRTPAGDPLVPTQDSAIPGIGPQPRAGSPEPVHVRRRSGGRPLSVRRARPPRESAEHRLSRTADRPAQLIAMLGLGRERAFATI